MPTILLMTFSKFLLWKLLYFAPNFTQICSPNLLSCMEIVVFCFKFTVIGSQRSN